MDWYYTNGRSKHGPIDDEGIRIRAQKGYVKPDTLLWNETMPEWETASELGFFPDDDVEPTICLAPPPPVPQRPAATRLPVPDLPSPPPVPQCPAATRLPVADLPSPPPVPSRSAVERPLASEHPPLPSVPSRSTVEWPSVPEPQSQAQSQPAVEHQPDEEPPSPAPEPPPEATPPAPLTSGQVPQPSINVSVNAGGGGESQPVSVGNWFLTFIVMCIPLVNIIMIFVWAFGGSTHKSKSNWARAALLLFVVVFLLWLLFFVALGVSVASAFG